MWRAGEGDGLNRACRGESPAVSRVRVEYTYFVGVGLRPAGRRLERHHEVRVVGAQDPQNLPRDRSIDVWDEDKADTTPELVRASQGISGKGEPSTLMARVEDEGNPRSA